MRIKRDFFEKNTVWVAGKLLGKTLVRKLPHGQILKGKIAETEAYCGPKDLASHARAAEPKEQKRCLEERELPMCI